MVVTIPAGMWRPEARRWSGPPVESELTVRPVGVCVEPDGSMVLTGYQQVSGADTGQQVAVRVRPEALPPQLRIGSGVACVIPAAGWWLPEEGDLVVEIEQLRPVAADPHAGVVTWYEVQGRRVRPDGTRSAVAGLARTDALPPQLRAEPVVKWR